MRAGYFFLDTDQTDAYDRWEDKQRSISTPAPNSDEPDTVARR